VPLTDSRSARRNYKLPATGNNLSDDMPRIADAVTAIDADIGSVMDQLPGKADAGALPSYQLKSEKNVANGYLGLDSSGLIPDVRLPLSAKSGLDYIGPWNASTNTPVMPAASAANKSKFYIVSVAGSTTVDGQSTWNATDWIVSDGVAWKRYPFSVLVSSVAGKTGTVTLIPSDVGLANVRSRNLAINCDFSISQENGDTAGNTSGYFPADGSSFAFSSSGAFFFYRSALVTPYGSKYRLICGVATIDAAVGAGDYLQFVHALEGRDAAALRWGKATAKPLIWRFMFNGPAGTYCAAARNGGLTRSCVKEFIVTAGQANTDTIQSVTFPAETAGTWDEANGVGIYLSIALAAGSTYRTTPNTFQNGNFIGTSSILNGMASASNVFQVADMGFYVDYDNNGIPPTWIPPDPAIELLRCKRYWQTGFARVDGYNFASGVAGANVYFETEMRLAAPAISQVDSGTVFNCSTTPSQAHVRSKGFYTYRAASAAGGFVYAETWVANARL
jgi:hypothetical protein